MPDQAISIGPVYDIYEPRVDELIALGYTHARVYWATSETASASLATSILLVSGTFDYAYNKTDGAETDWAYHAYYGVTPGEGPASDRVPVGLTRATRLLIRQGVGRRLRLMDGPYAITTASSSTAIIISELIDPDASVARFTNRFVRVAAGTAIGQLRRTRAGSSSPAGYVPATGTLAVGRATDPAWVAGDSVEIWRPKDDEDPSTLIDEAMNRVADRLYQPASFLFTTDEGVTEYFLPDGANELTISAVEWAGYTFPDRPGWQDVGRWEVTHDGGQAKLSLLRASLGHVEYGQGDIIRVSYAAALDQMDSDDDYWRIKSLRWAVAETALEFLDVLGTPSGGKEEVIDANRAKAGLQREIDTYRRKYLPVPRMKVAVAK